MSTSEQASMRAKDGSAASEPGPFPFLDALPVGIFIALPGRLPHYANREAVRLLGRGVLASPTGDHLRAYQAYVVGTNDPYPSERAPLVRALAGETAYADDMEIRRPDGSVVPLEVWGTPVVGPSGSVEYAIATFVDISKRRGAEAALASRRALLDLAHDAAFLSDTCARITYWNAGAEQTYGYTAAEALGRVSYELLHTEFPEPLADIKAKVARDGRCDAGLVQRRPHAR